jgi:MSHA pilin protein MshA
MKINTNRGFSLIELLVALSILAVVAAIIVPRFLNVRTQAATATVVGQQQAIQNAVQQWISLGGMLSGATAGTSATTVSQANAGLIISYLGGGTARTTTAAANACSDSSGTMGSGTIALGSLPVNGSTSTPGFSANYQSYFDGAGNTWAIMMNPATGNCTFSNGTTTYGTTN